MAQNGNGEKQVVIDINEQLWSQAKIRASIENIPLKDYVARAIENENSKVKITIQ